MFDVILEKYKKSMRSSLPMITYFQLCILILGIALLTVGALVKSSKLYIIGVLILMTPLLWICIQGAITEKKISKLKLVERFVERNNKFENFLKENGLDNENDKKWLRKICCERLSEKTKCPELIMPFATVVIFPIILIFVNLLLDNKAWEDNVKYILPIIVFTFLIYLTVKALESNISQISDRKYYYIKHLRDDLDISEFCSDKKEIRNRILENE